ncbi:hypothetical protein [Natrinema halophilum]|nr:hypothetical protein [Natrinema halophilum]
MLRATVRRLTPTSLRDPCGNTEENVTSVVTDHYFGGVGTQFQR